VNGDGLPRGIRKLRTLVSGKACRGQSYFGNFRLVDWHNYRLDGGVGKGKNVECKA
jgi:hypothetical protein